MCVHYICWTWYIIHRTPSQKTRLGARNRTVSVCILCTHMNEKWMGDAPKWGCREEFNKFCLFWYSFWYLYGLVSIRILWSLYYFIPVHVLVSLKNPFKTYFFGYLASLPAALFPLGINMCVGVCGWKRVHFKSLFLPCNVTFA